MSLASYYQNGLIEAGCDEAGRGCLAGPVFAAAVILSPDHCHPLLNDSKKLNVHQRNTLRIWIEEHALAWSVSFVDHEEIDRINILNASFKAMHQAIENLKPQPELLLIDGNRFAPYFGINHVCIVKGDSKMMSIAAASILAKTYRDAWIEEKHLEFPQYCWDQNKGYGTKKHVDALLLHGESPYHRKSFDWRKKMHHKEVI